MSRRATDIFEILVGGCAAILTSIVFVVLAGALVFVIGTAMGHAGLRLVAWAFP